MTPRERRLLLCLFALLFFGGHYLLGHHLWQDFQQLEKRAHTLQQEQELLHSVLSSSAEENAERQWLQDHPLPYLSREEGQNALQKKLQLACQSIGVKPQEQKLLPPEEGLAHFDRAALEVTIHATEPKIYLWLVQLHQPENYQAISQLHLRALNPERTQLSCTVLLQVWTKQP